MISVSRPALKEARRRWFRKRPPHRQAPVQERPFSAHSPLQPIWGSFARKKRGPVPGKSRHVSSATPPAHSLPAAMTEHDTNHLTDINFRQTTVHARSPECPVLRRCRRDLCSGDTALQPPDWAVCPINKKAGPRAGSICDHAGIHCRFIRPSRAGRAVRRLRFRLHPRHDAAAGADVPHCGAATPGRSGPCGFAAGLRPPR